MSHGTTSAAILTFDIGGTNTRAALYDSGTGRLHSRAERTSPSILTESEQGSRELWRALSANMTGLANDILKGESPRAISVAFPAPLDADGNALASPTLFGDQGQLFPVRRAVESLWPDTRVVVLNDLSAAGYRYVDRWADFCIVTVGSGIGHKVFLNGQPVVGPNGRGGECGHLVVDESPDAPLCDCGERGHLGGMASGRGAVRLARWRAAADIPPFRASSIGRACDGDPDRIDSYLLVAGFHSGDPWAVQVIAEAATLLGKTLAGMHLAIGLERFILMGGFAMGLGEDYRRLVAAAAGRACWRIGQAWGAMVHFCDPDDDHGLIGGARHAAAIMAAP